MSDVFVEFMDENGKRTSIRKDLIVFMHEKDDETIRIGVSWPWDGMEYFTFKGIRYGDFVNKITSLKEEK